MNLYATFWDLPQGPLRAIPEWIIGMLVGLQGQTDKTQFHIQGEKVAQWKIGAGMLRWEAICSAYIATETILCLQR